MSLFSRLEERMRARDSQDDSKEKEADSADDKGGLFGSIQLKPAQNAPSVPPPKASSSGVPTSGGGNSSISVPSLEEARAELDRIRAENAQSGQSSGLFRRDKAPEEGAAPAPRLSAPRPSAEASGARESVRFGAVDLPPREAEATPVIPKLHPEYASRVSPIETPEAPQAPSAPQPTQTVVTAEGKPFRVPSMSQFAEDETVPASDAATPPVSSAESELEQTVYAPVAREVAGSAERQVVARTEPQVVAPTDIVATVESLRFVPVRPNPPAAAVVFSEIADKTISEAGQESEPEPAPEERPSATATVADVQEKPAAPPANSAALTPFQRLMAARAAQGGAPTSRPRNERPTSLVSPRPAPEKLPNSGPIEVPEVEALPAETPEIEAPKTESLATLEAPTSVTPTLESPSSPTEAETESAPVAALEAPAEMLALPESPITREEESDAPVELAALSPDLSAEASSDEVAETEALALMPAMGATSNLAVSSDFTAPEPDAQPMPEMEATAMKTDGAPPQAEEDEPSAPSVRANEEAADVPAEPLDKEAETVPEETSTAASSNAPASPEMPTPETAESPVRPALSLAERLSRTPRADVDAPRSPDLAPEPMENTAPAAAPPRSGSLSFAERLAARNKPQVEPPLPATPPTSSGLTPVEPSFAPTSFESPTAPPAPEAPQEPSESPDETVSAPALRSGPRSFSERLAARTELDNHLQVPAPETPSTEQNLATHHTELARINEGAELSEREMKNRVLFRQKHLIFDNVIGSLDQRTLQNPTRETAKPQLEKGVDAALREYGLELEGSERNWLVDEFVREVTDLGALVPMLEDPSVNKIVVTGANDVSVERLGRIERTGVSFRDDDHLLSLVRRIAELSGGRVDAKVPLLDRPLPDGGRIRAKVPPLAPQPTLTIEKSTGNPFVVLKRQMDEKSRGDSLPYAQLRERIQQRLLREFEGDAAALAGDQDKLRLQVEEMIGSVIAEEHVAVTRAERASLVMDLLNEIVGLGPIEPLLNDPDVDEVMVNGPYQIYVERKGKLELTSARFRDNGHVMQVIDRIVAPLGRRVDEKSPMVDGRLRDGSRFNAIIPPLALSGPTMTIRKFARDPFTMSDLINFGTITREAAQFLQAAVEGRLNIVVSGGTGSGKTTTLNVLSSFIPSTERIVTIEDAAELQMRQEHVIRMETRPPNIEGVGEVGIRDLVKNSLRMRPDRIVVGECRGGEALDMLQAMNTGHDGSLTTAHSNGPRDTCKRLETMVMMAGFDLPVRAIREQISMAVQLVVHQERMRDGKRRVTAITEIVGMEGDVLTMQDIFRFEHEGMDDDGRLIGSLQATGMRPKYYETIIDNGGTISMDIFSPKPRDAAPRAKLNERGAR